MLFVPWREPLLLLAAADRLRLVPLTVPALHRVPLAVALISPPAVGVAAEASVVSPVLPRVVLPDDVVFVLSERLPLLLSVTLAPVMLPVPERLKLPVLES